MHLREHRARGDRTDDRGRQLPAELLGDLEGERLRALGVVGAEADVDERPVELEGELDREPAAVVVAPVDRVDGGAVDSGRDELLRLEARRAEHGRLDPLGGGACRNRVREVARRGAGEGRRAVLERFRAGDGDDPVLERVRRVGGVELEVERPEAERLGQARGGDERRQAGREPLLRGRRHRQERRVAPERGRPVRDRLPGQGRADLLEVVDRVERPETARAHADRLERVLRLAGAAAERNTGTEQKLARRPPFHSLDTSTRDWHRALASRLPRRHRAGPSASLDAERGVPRCRRPVYELK